MDQILFVEDNESIVEGLMPSLKLNHFSVTHAADFKTGKRLASSGNFNLVILDINLPDGNGLELCKQIHEAFPTLPIIMLTAQDDEATAVEGFANGATDFIRKPFGAKELLARLRRALSREVNKGGELRYEKLILESSMRTATYAGHALELTTREFDLLALLVKRAGGAVTRDEMLSLLDYDINMLDRSLDSYISHLRKKLKTSSGEKLCLKAVYGLGYRLEAA